VSGLFKAAGGEDGLASKLGSSLDGLLTSLTSDGELRL